MRREDDAWLANPHRLISAPIRAAWIRDGQPEARSRIVARTSDDLAFTAVWDCTAGRFDWFYDFDETICILQGEISVVDTNGVCTRLRAADTFHFPAGSHFLWTVPAYVLKVAFVHEPLTPKLLKARRVYLALTRGMRAGRGPPLAAARHTLAGD